MRSLADELADTLGVTELRLPPHHIREYLRQEGRKLQPASLRNWTRRDLLTRTDQGYDLFQVIRLLERLAVYGKLTKAVQDDTLSPREACAQIAECA